MVLPLLFLALTNADAKYELHMQELREYLLDLFPIHPTRIDQTAESVVHEILNNLSGIRMSFQSKRHYVRKDKCPGCLYFADAIPFKINGGFVGVTLEELEAMGFAPTSESSPFFFKMGHRCPRTIEGRITRRSRSHQKEEVL